MEVDRRERERFFEGLEIESWGERKALAPEAIDPEANIVSFVVFKFQFTEIIIARVLL